MLLRAPPNFITAAELPHAVTHRRRPGAFGKLLHTELRCSSTTRPLVPSPRGGRAHEAATASRSSSDAPRRAPSSDTPRVPCPPAGGGEKQREATRPPALSLYVFSLFTRAVVRPPPERRTDQRGGPGGEGIHVSEREVQRGPRPAPRSDVLAHFAVWRLGRSVRADEQSLLQRSNPIVVEVFFLRRYICKSI